MKNKEKILEKIHKDENFINLKRFDYSLNQLLKRYPDGAPNKVIALALDIPEEEVENIYKKIIENLREKMVKNE